MRSYLRLAACGAGLAALGGMAGGWPAAFAGAVALCAQLCAVALLRPAMGAPVGRFMARWMGGMAIRALVLSGLLVLSVTHRAELPLLATSLGFLGVLLPLLFLETRFLR